MKETVDYPLEPTLPQTRCLQLLRFFLPLVLTSDYPAPALWCYARSLHQLASYVLWRRDDWQRRVLGASPCPQHLRAAQALRRLAQRLRARHQAAPGSDQREAADWHYAQHYLQRTLPLAEHLLAEEEDRAGARVLFAQGS